MKNRRFIPGQNFNRQKAVSQREIIRRYEALKIEPEEPGVFNCYVCSGPECGYVMKTVAKDKGVTPMFISCPKCGVQSVSTFGQDIVPEKQPVFRWVAPSLKECLKLRDRRDLLEHYFKGGLRLELIPKEEK